MLRQFSIIHRGIDADGVMNPGSRRATVSRTRLSPAHSVTPPHPVSPADTGRRCGWLVVAVLAVSVIGSWDNGLRAQEWQRSGDHTPPRPNDDGDGRVRVKRPDRDVYQPPTLSPNVPANPLRESSTEDRPTQRPEAADRPHLAGESAEFEAGLRAGSGVAPGVAPGVGAEVHRPVAKPPLMVDPIALADPREDHAFGRPPGVSEGPNRIAPRPDEGLAGRPSEAAPTALPSPTPLRPVAHNEPRLARWADEPELAAPMVRHDAGTGVDGFACDSIGCDGYGCDGYGCDAIGCGRIGSRHRRLFNARISCDPCQWFGSVEVLLMFRKGDMLPPLVTTGPAGDADTAGELGQAGTSVLLGNERLLRDMTVGGRFMVGTWLDPRRDRSLTLRGWFAGEESQNFRYADPASGVLARPFSDVSGGQTPEPNTQLVAFPDRSSGSLQARLDSEIYGADVAVRQFLAGDFGGTVDVLYGYQYLRLNEGMGIRSTSMSLDDDFAPVGSVLALSDRFEAKNEFHGGQIGIASHYREGCWSFDGLLKVGFGQLRREALRRGETVTSIDTATAIADEGLLVRESNRGRVRDHTFGWVPELDLSLGWQRFPHCDVTVGYHLVVVTDALQVSGMIDRDLAVDLGNPPATARPAGNLRHQTFYVQGIHFGLQYAY